MTPQKKNIIIWSSVIGGSLLLGIIIYSVTIGKRNKFDESVRTDKEMSDLLGKIDKAKK